MYYICIIDQGGKNGTVPNMEYHLPQQHLIKLKKRITNHDVEQLVNAIGKTRKQPKIVGRWGPEEEGLPAILDYENLNL
jgi:hypothetical protein